MWGWCYGCHFTGLGELCGVVCVDFCSLRVSLSLCWIVGFTVGCVFVVGLVCVLVCCLGCVAGCGCTVFLRLAVWCLG